MFLLRRSQISRSIPRSNKHFVQRRTQASAASFQQWRNSVSRSNTNMASPSKIHLTVEDTGVLKNNPQTAETAARTSELLQENHNVFPNPLFYYPINFNKKTRITTFSSIKRGSTITSLTICSPYTVLGPQLPSSRSN